MNRAARRLAAQARQHLDFYMAEETKEGIRLGITRVFYTRVTGSRCAEHGLIDFLIIGPQAATAAMPSGPAKTLATLEQQAADVATQLQAFSEAAGWDRGELIQAEAVVVAWDKKQGEGERPDGPDLQIGPSETHPEPRPIPPQLADLLRAALVLEAKVEEARPAAALDAANQMLHSMRAIGPEKAKEAARQSAATVAAGVTHLQQLWLIEDPPAPPPAEGEDPAEAEAGGQVRPAAPAPEPEWLMDPWAEEPAEGEEDTRMRYRVVPDEEEPVAARISLTVDGASDPERDCFRVEELFNVEMINLLSAAIRDHSSRGEAGREALRRFRRRSAPVRGPVADQPRDGATAA